MLSTLVASASRRAWIAARMASTSDVATGACGGVVCAGGGAGDDGGGMTNRCGFCSGATGGVKIE